VILVRAAIDNASFTSIDSQRRSIAQPTTLLYKRPVSQLVLQRLLESKVTGVR
jgi:hypothetical protein